MLRYNITEKNIMKNLNYFKIWQIFWMKVSELNFIRPFYLQEIVNC